MVTQTFTINRAALNPILAVTEPSLLDGLVVFGQQLLVVGGDDGVHVGGTAVRQFDVVVVEQPPHKGSLREVLCDEVFKHCC